VKKIKQEMRAEYRRSGFGKLERGKFYEEVAKGVPSALIELPLTKVVATSEVAPEPPRVPPAPGEEAVRVTGRAKRRSRRHSAE
jgi:hypothetical protein